MLDKHQMIHRWLMQLGIPTAEANEEACSMEHSLSDGTMDIISRHVTMASSMLGSDAAYPEKMRAIAEKMRLATIAQPRDLTESEKIIQAVEKNGGLQPMIDAVHLAERAGGGGALEDLLDWVELLGGREAMEQMQWELRRIGPPYPTFASLVENVRLVKRAGGAQMLGQKLEILDRLGGLENALRLAELGAQPGGANRLTGVAELGCQMRSMLR